MSPGRYSLNEQVLHHSGRLAYDPGPCLFIGTVGSLCCRHALARDSHAVVGHDSLALSGVPCSSRLRVFVRVSVRVFAIWTQADGVAQN
jgi:hypothetical protein